MNFYRALQGFTGYYYKFYTVFPCLTSFCAVLSSFPRIVDVSFFSKGQRGVVPALNRLPSPFKSVIFLCWVGGGGFVFLIFGRVNSRCEPVLSGRPFMPISALDWTSLSGQTVNYGGRLWQTEEGEAVLHWPRRLLRTTLAPPAVHSPLADYQRQ